MNDNAKPKKKRKFLKILLVFSILLFVYTIINYSFFEKKAVYEINDSYWALEQPSANAPLLIPISMLILPSLVEDIQD